MRPLALWATPRTASTAFDKMMRTRGDHLVFTEPFSIPFYRGPEKRSGRYEVSAPEATFRAVADEVLAASTRTPVFVKEMAYQLGPLLNAEVLTAFTSTFIIRDPAWALPSLARVWPDFTDEEAGYAAQHRAWAILREQGERPLVIDSDELRIAPETVIEAWCAGVGVQWRPDALTWEPGMPVDWEPWAEWFTTAAGSTGFHPPSRGPVPSVDSDLARRIESCRACYEELAAARIGA